ncbi:MAG: hypothetical protein OXK79_07280, partial [Chloroflexota bacterium]|nr:hypothetical protein [Chloroflexota bacterium]
TRLDEIKNLHAETRPRPEGESVSVAARIRKRRWEHCLTARPELLPGRDQPKATEYDRLSIVRKRSESGPP